jgi:hypothetical protein
MASFLTAAEELQRIRATPKELRQHAVPEMLRENVREIDTPCSIHRGPVK